MTKMSYENPRTGMYQSSTVLDGCLISIGLFIVAYLAIGIVVEFGVFGLLYFTGHISDPQYGAIGLIGFPIAFLGAIISIPLYWAWRQNRLSKTHITVWRFMCRQCKMEWTYRQEPTGKKLS